MTHNYPYLKGLIKKTKARYLYSGLNVICVSDGVRDDALDKMKIKPKSIHVIYNGIDRDEIRRRALGSNPYAGEDYIVNVSRFVPEKRHDLLIDAFIKSGVDCKLLLIGEGPESEKYKAYVASRGWSDRIVFLGRQKNPLPILKGARIMVHTADFEGFGLVLLESLVLGTPVVSRDCPSGPSEILVGELAENLVPMDDFDLLVERIKNQYSMGKSEFDRYTTKFTFDEIVPKYESLIQNESL